MGKVVDILGQRFARVRVLSYVGIRRNKAIWLCLCDCGNRFETEGKKLRTGHTKSCNCLQRSKAAERFRRHGMFYSREHRAWTNARIRCYTKVSKDYPNYGG